MTTNERIKAAFDATEESYLASCLAQRAGVGSEAAGSVYSGLTPDRLKQALFAARWTPYVHPEILPGCSAFRSELPGQIGVVRLDSLQPGTEVTLDDRKDTGKVSAVVEGVRGEEVSFTVLILGPDEDENGEEIAGSEVVWTFHPGDPIAPSRVPAEGRHGEVITAREAVALGLEWAKII